MLGLAVYLQAALLSQSSGPLNIDIPDGQDSNKTTLTFPWPAKGEDGYGEDFIKSVEVSLWITHSYVSELEAYLTYEGRRFALVKGAGGETADFGEDGAYFTIADYGVCIASQYEEPGNTKVYMPDSQTFEEVFENMVPYGTWELEVMDTVSEDAGVLKYFEINIETT